MWPIKFQNYAKHGKAMKRKSEEPVVKIELQGEKKPPASRDLQKLGDSENYFYRIIRHYTMVAEEGVNKHQIMTSTIGR